MTAATENGSVNRVRKSFTIAPDVWGRFEAMASARGLDPSVAVRMVVTDLVSSHHSQVEPALWDEIVAYCDRNGLTTTQALKALIKQDDSGQKEANPPRGDPWQLRLK